MQIAEDPRPLPKTITIKVIFNSNVFVKVYFSLWPNIKSLPYLDSYLHRWCLLIRFGYIGHRVKVFKSGDDSICSRWACRALYEIIMADPTDDGFKDPLGVNKPPDDGPTSSSSGGGGEEESVDEFDLDVRSLRC